MLNARKTIEQRRVQLSQFGSSTTTVIESKPPIQSPSSSNGSSNLQIKSEKVELFDAYPMAPGESSETKSMFDAIIKAQRAAQLRAQIQSRLASAGLVPSLPSDSTSSYVFSLLLFCFLYSCLSPICTPVAGTGTSLICFVYGAFIRIPHQVIISFLKHIMLNCVCRKNLAQIKYVVPPRSTLSNTYSN